MNRKSLIVLGALVISFVSIHLMTPKNTEAQGPKELKVGAYISLSGPGAPYGVAAQRGFDIAVEDINKAGGISVGNEKYLIKTITYDHKFTSEGGLEAVNRLIFQDKVKFIGATFGTGANLAGLSVTEPNKVIHLSTASGSPVLARDKLFSFRVVVGVFQLTKVQYRWLGKKFPEAKTVALLNRDDAWGRDMSKCARLHAEAQGMKVVYDDFFKMGTSDFSPWLIKVIASKADILDHSGTTPGEGGIIVKLARQLGYKGIILTSASGSIETIMQLAGPEYAEGVIIGNVLIWEPDDPQLTPMQREFVKKYIGKYKEGIQGLSPQTYDGMIILAKAIEKAKSLDTTVVRDTMATMEYDGLLQGKARFGGEEIYGIRRELVLDVPMVQCIKGKFKVVGIEVP